MFGWRRRRPWWFILLAVWLIATGVIQLTGRSIPYSEYLLPAIAIAAGVLLILDR